MCPVAAPKFDLSARLKNHMVVRAGTALRIHAFFTVSHPLHFIMAAFSMEQIMHYNLALLLRLRNAPPRHDVLLRLDVCTTVELRVVGAMNICTTISTKYVVSEREREHMGPGKGKGCSPLCLPFIPIELSGNV